MGMHCRERRALRGSGQRGIRNLDVPGHQRNTTRRTAEKAEIYEIPSLTPVG